MKATAPGTITCIYCRQVRAPTREHVLPSSLGGDFVHRILCKDCNGRRLSSLDQALAERSLVSLSRVGFTPEAAFHVQLGGDHFLKDDTSGLVMDVAVMNEMHPIVLPQVHVFLDGGQKRLSILAPGTDDLARLNAFVIKRLDNGRLLKMHVKRGPEEAGESARLVMHRDDDGYLRVQRDADAQLLVSVLQDHWREAYEQHTSRIAAGGPPPEARSIPKPAVHVHVSVRPDDTNRAVAKIALNVLAARVCAEFALSPEFDDLRRYILGEDIRRPERAESNEVLVDPRFVFPLPHASQAIVPTDEHAVTLSYVSPTLYAWVTLYKTHNFIVKLGDIALAEELFAVHEFSTIRRGNVALGVSETYKRLRTRGQSGGRA